MFLIFTENGKVLAKVLAKLCKHFSNLRKTFPNFSRFLDFIIDEVLALDSGLNSAKSYLRKQVEIGRTTTGDLNKSAALATFQKRSEKSNIFLHHFGNPAPNRD